MLKVFQLRVARSTLNLGVRDIGAYINLSRSTVSKIERMDIHSEINITDEQNTILIKIFNDKGLFFPNVHSISYKDIHFLSTGSLTRFQLRAGRAILGLSQRELSEFLHIKKSDLNYLENLDNTSYVAIKKTVINQNDIKMFFESKNIQFPNDGTILFSI